MSPFDRIDDLGKKVEAAAGLDPEQLSRRERVEITKTALREVLKEWLDDRLRDFGKWSLRGIAAAALAALLYFVLTHTGWTRQ